MSNYGRTIVKTGRRDLGNATLYLFLAAPGAAPHVHFAHVVQIEMAHRFVDFLFAVLLDGIRDFEVDALHDDLRAFAGGGRGGGHHGVTRALNVGHTLRGRR